MTCVMTCAIRIAVIHLYPNTIYSSLIYHVFNSFCMAYRCMLPGDIGDLMEGCPKSNTLVYLILSALIVPYLFTLWMVAKELYRTLRGMKKQSSRKKSMNTADYVELQLELFGEKALKNLKHAGSSHHVVKLSMV